MIDKHAHLRDPVFDHDRDLVIEGAKTSGIGITIAVGEDLADGRKNLSALPGVEAGYYFALHLSIVRSRQKQRLVKSLPLSCLLAGNDNPVVGPVLDERNEPANVAVSVDAIAEIKGLRREAGFLR